ncbi:unnamed protein product [Allacma fusca]|uniref:Tim10-like domain-containing protein n=1 Tax=Allacma fusca TaxID=39272 RepID=A0A8J2PF13_9HEXA|nr:unnamed protein product [Allacma fusca]
MSLSGLGGSDSVNKDELMDQVKQQIAVVNAQELLQKMTDKCFRKCVTKPGSSLDSGEQKCIAMCMDRDLGCREDIGLGLLKLNGDCFHQFLYIVVRSIMRNKWGGYELLVRLSELG